MLTINLPCSGRNGFTQDVFTLH